MQRMLTKMIKMLLLLLLLTSVRLCMYIGALCLFLGTHTINDCFMIMTAAFMDLRRGTEVQFNYIGDNSPTPFF